MKLAILTAIHGRHELSRLMLEHTSEVATALMLEPDWDIRLCAVISPEDEPGMADTLDHLGVAWCTWPNKPVSAKWQHGLTFLRHEVPTDIDAVMRIDSDDFVSIEWFRAVKDKLAGDTEAIGPGSVWFLHPDPVELVLWEGPWPLGGGVFYPCGPGRTWSRELLDRVDWVLWPGDVNTGLNQHCSLHLRSVAGVDIECLDPRECGAMIVDVKGSDNIHPWEEFWTDVQPCKEKVEQYLAAHGLALNRMLTP